jgi:hypothetical protein
MTTEMETLSSWSVAVVDRSVISKPGGTINATAASETIVARERPPIGLKCCSA